MGALINVSCIVCTVLIQKHVFVDIWKQERIRALRNMRKIGPESDVSSLHRDVNFLLAQLDEARNFEKNTKHLGGILDADYGRHALHKSGNEQWFEQSYVT